MSGVWHTEVEYVSNIWMDMEFDLHQGIFSRKWSGNWEIREAMSSRNELTNLQVAGDSLEMDLTPSLKFKARLSDDGASLVGVLYAGSREIPQTYTRTAKWASMMPARVDEEGRAVRSWEYRQPELIEDDWSVASLRDAGIDQQQLSPLLQKVLSGEYQGLDAVLIARGGDLVLEEYFHFGSRAQPHQVQSVTKSVSSLVFGRAYDENLIGDLETPVYDFFPDYAESPWVKNMYPISLYNILTMSAGLDWREHAVPYTNPENVAIRMNNSGDMYGFVLSIDQAKNERPGQRFEYTSGLSILLGGVVLNATGMGIDQYAENTLFKELGIENYYWNSHQGQVHTGGGLYLRARDLLKLGQLVLDKGKWNGQQVLSEEWVEGSTAFHLPIRGASRDGGYGFQWWRETLRVGGQSFPTIYASGYAWQLMWIIPDLDLVVLVLHHNPEDAGATHSITEAEMEQIILPAMIQD